jgi:heme-degrading monooxygenase HmoA
MSVVKINAITVPTERADEMAARFAARAGQVDNQAGFEEFQLLRPADDRQTWLVYTRWRDQDAFEAWVNSPAFTHGHARPQATGGDEAGGDAPPPTPVGTASELWEFVVEQRNGPSGSTVEA